MWIYIIRRLLWLPVVLFAVSFMIFSLGRLGPGDPVTVILGNKARPEVKQRLREEMGLNRPFYVQYGEYMWGFMRGDFGESFRYRGQSVRDLIIPKMWVSAQLSLVSLMISLGFGLPLGFFIAHKQGSWVDPTIVTISLILMSIPIMVTVPFLLWVLCLKLNWIPCSGWGGIFDSRIVVPAVTMGLLLGTASFLRLMRASTLDVMGQDFIRTARSKGLSTTKIDIRHVLRNAIIPIITILAFSLAGLVGGAIVIETIMGIPGIGRFSVQAVFDRDYPVIMAIGIIAAAFFIVATLLADLAYAYIDPRIRYR